MDIAYYLSELLEQLGEVNVPGLGSFTRVKVDGYYNSEECRFYPPSSKIEFNQQYVDDDVLARYIGVKKRISLASSKYFTEKYLNGLRQEIMSKPITLADVGQLYFENGEICFKAAETLSDPAFFGYPQITLNKLGDEPVVSDTVAIEEPEREPEPEIEEEIERETIEEYVAPVIQDEPAAEDDYKEFIHEETIADFEENKTGQEGRGIGEEVATGEVITQFEGHETGQEEYGIDDAHNDFTPEVIEDKTHTDDDDDFLFHTVTEDEVEEEEQPRSYKWLWITLIVLLIAGGGVFGYFYYLQQQEPKVVKKIKPLPAKDTTDSALTADTMQQTAVTDAKAKTGTTAELPLQNSPSATIDSTKRRYEVIGAETQTLAEANKVIANYKSIGVDAHIVSDAPGKRKKISLGTYASKSEAIAAASTLSKAKKVKGAWPLQINPKK